MLHRSHHSASVSDALGRGHDDALMAAVESDVSALITSEREDERRNCAQAVHALGRRHSSPFVEFDCGSWGDPAEGRHSGLGRDRDDVTVFRRRLRDASGGTLFVDRIEMMGDGVRAELFGLFEHTSDRSGVGLPNGVRRPRILSGASRSLMDAIAAGTFDETLFFRLNVIHLDLTSRHHLEGGLMKVRDLMSTPPHTCRPDTDLGAIARMMWDHDLGFVPVIDASGHVAGIVTDRDICIATATRHLLPDQISAVQAMTGPVHTCVVDDSVDAALAAMKEFKVRRLPVVDASGQLQGVISMNDLALASDQKRKPAPGDVVSTLAAICAHRTAATVTT
jgi:CBS domain-containing protein